jgi:hypothetical protein
MYVNQIGNPPYMINLNIPEPVDFWKRYSADNLMGAGTDNPNPRIEKYYMYQIRDWFEKETGISWDVQI